MDKNATYAPVQASADDVDAVAVQPETRNSKPETDVDSWLDVDGGEHDIPLALIREAPDDARTIFDDELIRETADSIAAAGQIEPAIVRSIPVGDRGPELFQLVSGRRRLRATMLLGRETLWCVVSSVASEEQARYRGLIANLARVDLTPLEICTALWREYELGGFASVRAFAEHLAKNGLKKRTESVRDIMDLKKLIPDAAESLRIGEITFSHAVLIAGETPADQQRALLACFERETVTIGALPEAVTRLVSEKALRAWIQSHLREPASDEGDAEKLAQKRLDAEKRSDGERALEREGARLADREDDEDCARTVEPAGAAPAGRDTANADDSAEIAEQVREMVKYLNTEFKADWRPGVLWVVVVKSLLCELQFERSERELRTAEFKAAVNAPRAGRLEAGDPKARACNCGADRTGPSAEAHDDTCPAAGDDSEDGFKLGKPKAKKKRRKPLNETQVAKHAAAAALKIFEGFEIDDTDVTSMRETGMTDESIRNLVEAHHGVGPDSGVTLSMGKDVYLTFDAEHFELFYEDDEEGDSPFCEAWGQAYIDALRAAMKVGLPSEETAPKTKPKKTKKAA